MNLRSLGFSMLLLAAAGLIACGGSQTTTSSTTQPTEQASTDDDSAPTAIIRMVHGADAGSASASLGDIDLGSGLTGGSASAFMEVPVGSRTLTVRTSSGTSELGSARLTLEADADYTVFVLGDANAGPLDIVLVENTFPEAPAGSAFVRLVHGVPGAGPGTLVADGRQYASNVAYGQVSNYYQIPAGSHTFELAGTDATVTVNVASGEIYSILAGSSGSTGARLVPVAEH